MVYCMNEGRMTLPFDYADSSMTILKFPAEQSSLTIVRGEMPPHLSLAETLALQRNLFLREFKTVILGDNKPARLGATPFLDGMEFYCMFDKAAIRQYQMNLLIKERGCFITFSYTRLQAFSPRDIAHWEQIKSDFVIDPQWYQSISRGAEHE